MGFGLEDDLLKLMEELLNIKWGVGVLQDSKVWRFDKNKKVLKSNHASLTVRQLLLNLGNLRQYLSWRR